MNNFEKYIEEVIVPAARQVEMNDVILDIMNDTCIHCPLFLNELCNTNVTI